MIVALVGLAGCGDSTSNLDEAIDSTSEDPSDQLNSFADSVSVNERFGTRTSRELSPQVEAATRDAVVAALSNFSFDMHNAIATEKPNEGSVESGFSAALALLLSSAATGSDTYAGLVHSVGYGWAC